MLKYFIAAGTLVVGVMVGLVIPVKPVVEVPQPCQEAYESLAVTYMLTSQALINEEFVTARILSESALDSIDKWLEHCE